MTSFTLHFVVAIQRQIDFPLIQVDRGNLDPGPDPPGAPNLAAVTLCRSGCGWTGSKVVVIVRHACDMNQAADPELGQFRTNNPKLVHVPGEQWRRNWVRRYDAA